MEVLEFAAENDVEKFKTFIDQNPTSIDAIGLWYVRTTTSKHTILDHRTPLLVAVTYGSIDVVNHIISFPNVDVNRRVGRELTTPLHCAASGGSLTAIDVVRQLISAGADSNSVDSNGLKPSDVIFVNPKLGFDKQIALTEMLGSGNNAIKKHLDFQVLTSSSSSDADYGYSTPSSGTISSPHSVMVPKIPDIRNSTYSSDEFRMYSFKVHPCSKAYSHDWTECPFARPGENARRRNPRKFHYSSVPCPDFRNGDCCRGDLCEHAHGVFECWLHPVQYRTRLCKDGIGCSRRVCFFAHCMDELRLMSPRSIDMSRITFSPPMLHNVPTLHLTSNSISSRLMASLSARDMRPSNLDDVFCARGNYMNLNQTLGVHYPCENVRYLRSFSSRELGSNVGLNSNLNLLWSNWGSPNGKLDWGVSGEELDMINRSKDRIDEHDVDDDWNDEHEVLEDWFENMQLGNVVTS